MAKSPTLGREHQLNGQLTGLMRAPEKNRVRIIETRIELALERAHIASVRAAEQLTLAQSLRSELEALDEVAA